MRMLSLIACLALAANLYAQEQPAENAPANDASAAPAAEETATEAKAAEKKDDANMNDAASDTEAQQGVAKAARPAPLHRTPILLKMLKQNNFLRNRSSRHTQSINVDLTEAAQDHAEYMARTGYYDHYVNGNPYARATRHGFKGAYAGEIIHRGPTTIVGAFDGWMHSPPHHSILMGGAQEAGFGHATSTNGTEYWVGLYGTPAKPVSGSGDSNLSSSTESVSTGVTYNPSRRQRRQSRRRRR